MSIVYILTNEAMPGFIKIGRTETSVEQRMSELDKTAIPLPFECFYAARVEDYAKVERALHTAFGDARVRPSREFFSLDAFRAKAVLELLAVEDVTPVDGAVAGEEDRDALAQVIKKGTKFDFSRWQVPVGTELQYAQDSSLTCVVVDDNRVDYRGQLVSLSKAAGLANLDRGGLSTSFAGPSSWILDGETLASRRRRIMEAE